MSKVTIQTVADKAGVSIKTVSRVINNEPSVRETTREKVQAIINKLGYEPSPAARALASNSSKIIGLIYDNPSSAYINAVQNGALKACSAAGYNLVIHPCNHESKNLSEELISLVQKSRMNGLILTPPICDIQKSSSPVSILIFQIYRHPKLYSVCDKKYLLLKSRSSASSVLADVFAYAL